MYGCLHLITKSEESSSEIPCIGAGALAEGTNEIFALENHFTFYERKPIYSANMPSSNNICEIVSFQVSNLF